MKISTNQTKNKVAVVGGGLTGLVAAYELCKSGHEVVVLEAQNDLGGLASGFDINGTNLEKAYHHIFKTDTDVIALIKELGLESQLKWHKSSIGIVTSKRVFAFNSPLDLLRFSAISIWSRIRVGLVFLYLKYKKNWRDFVAVSAESWLRKFVGRQAYEVMWRPLLDGKFHRFASRVSMAWFWARVNIRTNSRDGGEMLGYLHGGFAQISDRLASRIETLGGLVLKNTPVISIDSSSDSLYLNTSESSIRCDRLIVSAASHVLAKLAKPQTKLQMQYVQKLQSIEYIGAVCLIFTSNQEISEYYWHNVCSAGAPFLVFLNHTRLVDRSEYGGKYVYYLAAYVPHDHRYFECLEEELKSEWFGYLSKIFKDFDLDRIGQSYLFRLKNAQHIVDLNYEQKIPEHLTPFANIYLSNFSQIFPEDRGTNFAVRDGRSIANIAILDKLR